MLFTYQMLHTLSELFHWHFDERSAIKMYIVSGLLLYISSRVCTAMSRLWLVTHWQTYQQRSDFTFWYDEMKQSIVLYLVVILNGSSGDNDHHLFYIIMLHYSYILNEALVPFELQISWNLFHHLLQNLPPGKRIST